MLKAETSSMPAIAIERHHRPSRPLSLTLELLFMLAWREIAIKYKQSVMGFLWAILMPSLIVGAGLIVRAGVAQVSGTPLPTDAMAGIAVKALPWAFFVSAIRFSTNSFAANSNLVTRANCPRIVFPLASTLSALFDLGIAIVPLVVVLTVFKVPVTLALLWVVPLLVVLVLLVGGLGLALATANLFYRDVKYLVEVLLMFGIFFTPVIFDVAMLGEWGKWILFNPVSPLLEGLYACVVLGRTPDLAWFAYSAIISLAVAAGALVLFRRLEPSFADNI